MKKIIAVLFLAFCLPAVSVAAGQVDKEANIVVQKEQKSVFKGLLYSVWGKLRSLSPRANKRTHRVVTAGVRGAETTDSLIDPYWKGDKTDDPDYIKELTEFNNANQLAENGDLQGAVKAFSSFISDHGNSDLKANAQFAMGISYGGMGQVKSSVNTLSAFVKDNPTHPMVSDAKQVIAELQ
ncbi:tol-pal system YbgF family protein [Pseudomonadota bacterium]